MNRYKVDDDDYAARADLHRRRLAEIDPQLAALAQRRKQFALGALDNDKPSLRGIEQIDCEAETLRRERDTLNAAIEHLERLQREQLAENERRERERREAEARKLANAIVAQNAEIDTAFGKLRQLFEQRAVLLRHLGDTQTIPSTLILRMHQRFGPTCAARKAGLHDFLSLEFVPVGQIRSLVESNNFLSGPLTAAVEEEAAA
jgi:hypothetical protein